jgi:hypothetical protein
MAVLTFLDRDKSFARPGYSRRLVPPAALFFGSSPTGRYAAAICFLLGSLLTRYAWIWAGPASADDPHALFTLQRKN